MQAMIDRMQPKHYDRHNSMITIATGVEVDQQPPTRRVRILPNTTTAILQHRVGANWHNVPGVPNITLAHVTAFVNFIRNNSFATGQHRQVLNNVAWRTFYHVGPRVLTWIGQTGLPLAPAPNGDTVPCFDCGLVLPLRNIEIDHQRPQAGNRHEPVAKVFRALGLTVDGPGGDKGVNVFANHGASVAGLASANTGNHASKYTLNDVGQIYYTIADWSGVLLVMEEACMNHFVNLRPLCSACNTPNRNVRHY